MVESKLRAVSIVRWSISLEHDEEEAKEWAVLVRVSGGRVAYSKELSMQSFTKGLTKCKRDDAAN